MCLIVCICSEAEVLLQVVKQYTSVWSFKKTARAVRDQWDAIVEERDSKVRAFVNLFSLT